ncbi:MULTISPECIES: GAF domain-containing sensor histidine kinase [Variovorax]|uniref:GAF domain-containing sensor histidine kinase n=1 Tax=Variovorax TaxID=34072 RepID=UPI00086B6C35|nr:MULTISPECIES: GAF domain-containing sensor histidine kinase [Variovorax]MBN8753278.1 GAF domain-containing sensor histidine kinase [Variovorax sp.]ODU11461.1 MAG: histidine kinase [Variovorax sp. SCN 67-85]ODV27352.1 MAG: histidine kinase [Variovorax sp. SCN 67-20]OJZ11924.1 MAG: histidine kinase [Variovorax sp. 67-131]UKI05474.1 GAF domain-containing sensor histidine kinase [Variovorax paradoxus]
MTTSPATAEPAVVAAVDTGEAIARDVAAIARISAVPSLLKVICQHTGMGFAAVARVTDGTWTACAVEDTIQFGLKPGGQLQVQTTLCSESRAARQPVVIDQASTDPVYFNHHTPRLYNIESYISVPIIHSNGDYFGNLCAIDPRPAQVSDPRVVAMFTAFADLIARQLETEDRQERTETALQSAQATAELREQFIAVLGHDLRNPLSSVGAAAELLIRRQAEPDLVKLGTRLKASTRRMSALIDDVLDLARVRLGSGMGLEIREAGFLAAGLRDVIDEVRAAHPALDIRDELSISGAVRCDQGRIQQVLSNLLGNAVAHGAPDQPIVARAEVRDSQLVLSVANGGDPIPPGDITKIFQPYWRPQHSKPGGGLGLGLYICAEIVAAHGGTLQVTSCADDGTCFVATLPVA